MTVAVLLHKLSKKFGRYEAVREVSLSVFAGTTLGLIGANGAGKTTTIAMIMGLISPTSGTVEILGMT